MPALVKQRVQLVRDLGWGTWLRAGDRSSPCRRGRRHRRGWCGQASGWTETSIERRAAEPGVEHDGRAARADTVDVEPIAADVDQLAGRGIAARIPGCGNRLVAGPSQPRTTISPTSAAKRAADPAQHPPHHAPGSGMVCSARS